MHLLSNIWSDVSVMESESLSQRERYSLRERGAGREERENELSKCPAMHTTYTWSGAKSKPKTTMQVCPGMRQELGFIRLAIIQTQEWTAVLQNNLSFQTAPH